MKVEVIKDFNDLQEKKPRKVGDIFECTLDRATFLSNHNVVAILLDDEKEEEPYVEPEETKEEIVEEKPKFKKKKNKK